MGESTTKVAIVGTSIMLSESEERNIIEIVSNIIKSSPRDATIISGGSLGVDSIAIEVAEMLAYKTEVYKPETNDWEGYKERNLWLARDCDELHCISVPVHKQPCYHHSGIPAPHEKTAGCWTLNKAKELDKKCELLVTAEK